MKTSHFTKDEVIAFAKSFRDEVPARAASMEQTKSGKTEWTRAIWDFFDSYRNELSREWVLFPKTKPVLGRVRGEYLADFALMCPKLGFRIACESEWGTLERVSWALDKLRNLKADIKVLVFQAKYHSDGLPKEYQSKFAEYLAASHHHFPDREFYLFVQFEGEKAKLFLWEPKTAGPLEEKEVIFEEIA